MSQIYVKTIKVRVLLLKKHFFKEQFKVHIVFKSGQWNLIPSGFLLCYDFILLHALCQFSSDTIDFLHVLYRSFLEVNFFVFEKI